MTPETSIIDEFNNLGLLVAYHCYLDDSRSCLLDTRQFEEMVKEYEAAEPKTDFWEFQREWFRKVQRAA
jgi:hypothetical protein